MEAIYCPAYKPEGTQSVYRTVCPEMKCSAKYPFIKTIPDEQLLTKERSPVHGVTALLAAMILVQTKETAMIHHLPSAFLDGSRENSGSRADMAPLVGYFGAAYNLARWLMRSESEAEDVVQEAYLRAIRHLSGFRGGDGRAWLLTIVRNGCYDRLRQKGAAAQKNTDFNEALHSGVGQTVNPESALLLAERRELVQKSLAELPAEYREVLILREMEQLSYREIANVAEIPLGTVMSRLSRARLQLQKILSDYAGQKGFEVAIENT
jgi:RNA polymerase sigma-70 factor, ECF subfamily